jgi:signal transduction histidine kinase
MAARRTDTVSRSTDGDLPPSGNGQTFGHAHIPVPDPAAGSPFWRRFLNAEKRALLTYIGGSIALTTAVVAVSPHLNPLALGAVMMGALLVAGWLMMFGRPVFGKNHNRRVLAVRNELDLSRRRYQRLFSAVPCFICVLDRDHQILEANELYRREFGATDRSRCYEVCKHRTSKCPNCVVDATFGDGKNRTNEEVLVTLDGRRINAVVHTQPILDRDGEMSAVMEVFTDVTEVKRLERQLALTGRAVAGTAHRVKNILMGLDGGMFIVNDGLEEDNRAAIEEGWEMVERNVQRVTAVVKDLLFCAKERIPEFQLDVCPQDIVLEVRDLFADRMAEENIEIRTELSEPPHRGTYDPDGIHNLLCNLVANAIDACRFDPCPDKPGHTVVVRCFLNGEGATVFEVQDDGAGIPENLSHKVFQEFFSSKGTEGTGIGLLVVQKVAEEHGGNVTFESKPGHGTVFTVTLPQNSRTANPREPASDHEPLRVLP